jgi:hypothetical protein
MTPLTHSRPFRLSRIVVLCAIASFPASSQPARTPQALMQHVLDAVERRDEQRLKELAMSKQDFKTFIWPSLRRTIVARLGIKADTFYAMSMRQSDLGLVSTINEFGGRKWILVQVAPLTAERHPIRRKRFTAYSGPAVSVREGEGNERTVHLVGGVVQLGGVYKVSTYSLAPDQKQ